MTTKKKRYATKAFIDAGTERIFEKGEEIKAEAAEIANYEAAGLAGDKPEAAKPA